MKNNYEERLSQITEEEKQDIVTHVELCRDYSETKYLAEDDVKLYNAIIEEREKIKEGEVDCESNSLEKLVLEAKALAENAPDGFVTDGDTLLCDIMEEADFQVTGLAADIFNIWLKSSDRKSVESLFYDFTDVEFEDFVNLCIEKTTRRD